MSVLIETSLGDLVIDLEIKQCPKTCENFLKLCKVKYYNLNAFFNVSKDFIAQTGDPSATGTGGESFLSLQSHSHSPSTRYFTPEIQPTLKHVSRGTVSMAVAPSSPPGCGSQFFITLKDDIEYLDGKHAVFGHVVEGEEVLDKLNEVFVDKDGRPLKDIRIRHIEILEDPFPDPENLIEPPSPIRPPDDPSIVPRIGEDETLEETRSQDEIEASKRAQAAAASALTLEMIGDLPFANVRPPENILFVCKLNPVTQDEDLELIFSRFGKILSCEVIRDKRTGDSLQYAFIEFDERESAEMAYFKMQNVLVDDRRIWVDFSQSVSKINGVYSVDRSKSSAMRGGRGGSRGGGGGFRGGGRGRGGGGGMHGEHTSSKGYGLETPSRYREGGGGEGGKGGYGMVFDEGDMRSRRDDGSRHRDRERERERERDPDERKRDDRRRDDRERERSFRDKERDREDRMREGGRYERDRERERDRSPRREERRRDR